MKKGIGFSKKFSYVFLSLTILILGAVSVYAAVPNPGHAISGIEPPSGCTGGQVLTWTGASWGCYNQPSFSSPWETGVGTSIYYDNSVGIGSSNPLSDLSIGATGSSSYSVYVSAGDTYGIYTKGSSRGIYGTSTGIAGTGVYGISSGSSSYGVSGSGTATGVYGTSTSGGKGIEGSSSSSGGIGVHGRGYLYGVYGSNNPYGGYGILGYNDIGVYGNGDGYDFLATGSGTNYGSSSSIRWKDNIEPIDSALSKVLDLNGVYYNWDEEHGGEYDMGFIAEEVGQVVPEVVGFEDASVESNWYLDENGEKVLYATAVDYGALTPLLVEAIKEQQEIIDDLKSELCSKDSSYSWC